MFTSVIAQRLGGRGHDVAAVVTDQALLGLSDEQILAAAAAGGRALVTANIKDFAPLDAAYKAPGRNHAGLVLVSTKTRPKTDPSSAPSWKPSPPCLPNQTRSPLTE